MAERTEREGQTETVGGNQEQHDAEVAKLAAARDKAVERAGDDNDAQNAARAEYDRAVAALTTEGEDEDDEEGDKSA